MNGILFASSEPRCFPGKGILLAFGTEDPASLWEHTSKMTRSGEHEITFSISEKGRDGPRLQASLIPQLLLPSEGLLAFPGPSSLVCLSCRSSGGCHLLVEPAGRRDDQVLVSMFKAANGPHGLCWGKSQ